MQLVTAIYDAESELRLCDDTLTLDVCNISRVVIPAEYIADKQKIAVLEGKNRLL